MKLGWEARIRIAAALAVMLAAAQATVAVPALASGVTKIQHSDGRRNEYPGATIHLYKSKQQLTVTSPDGKDTLIVGQAACSFVGQLQRCLLGSISLKHGDGEARPIPFDAGTMYINLTSDKQTLPLSSKQVPPNGVILAMHTVKGTFINVTGTFDGSTE